MLDHLVYAVLDVEAACDDLEQRLATQAAKEVIQEALFNILMTFFSKLISFSGFFE